MQGRIFSYFIVIVTALSVAACGGGGSSSDSTDSTGTTDTTSTTAVDSTGDTVPSDLAISSPTAATSGTTSLSAKGLTKAASNFEDKKEAVEQLLAGTSECSFTLQIPTSTRPDCYGPTVNYCNHPNATGSDPDCVVPEQMGMDDGQLPQGDLGLWSASEDDEACAAAQMNYLVESVAGAADIGINLSAAMACAGEKAKLTLPAVGETLDLTSTLSEHLKITGLTVNTATATRLADASDGNPVFKYDLNTSMLLPGDSTAKTFTLSVTHIPTKTDKTTYRGEMRMTMNSTTDADNNCQQGTQGHLKVVEISYDKSGSTLKYDMNSAPYCGQNASPTVPMDPADKVSASNTDGWGGNWNYGRFNVNTSNGTGTVGYAWQAGQGDGFSRVFNITTTTNSDNSATGTAYFGFGPDIATAEGRGTIKGFFCNWAGPGNQKTPSSTSPTHDLAQKQTMTRSASGTKFTADSGGSLITFAPTNTCDAASGLRYAVPTNATTKELPADGVTTGLIALDNNKVSSTTTVTNNLIDKDDIVFTQPTAPTTTDL